MTEASRKSGSARKHRLRDVADLITEAGDRGIQAIKPIFGLVMLVFFAIAMVLAMGLSTLQNRKVTVERSLEEYRALVDPRLSALTDLMRSLGLGGVAQAYGDLVIYGRPEHAQQVIAAVGAAKSAIRRFRTLVLSEEEQRALASIDRLLDDYLNATRQLRAQPLPPSEALTLIGPTAQREALASIDVLRQVGVLGQQADDTLLRRASLLAEMYATAGLRGLIDEVYQYLVTGDLSARTRADVAEAQLEELVERYRRYTRSAAEAAALEDLSEAFQRYREIMVSIRDGRAEGLETDAMASQVLADPSGALDAMLILERELAEEVASTNDIIGWGVNSIQRMAVAVIYVSVIAAIAITVLIYWFVVRRMTTDLKLRKSQLEQELVERKAAEAQVRAFAGELERKVAERTVDLSATNAQLTQTLDQLKNAQEQLVENEKLAALGGLVAGIAHEINTPIGIGTTAASHLDESIKTFRQTLDSGKLRKSDLQDFLARCDEATDLIRANLVRAADLIRSFKTISVDQGQEDCRPLQLKDYIEDIAASLGPRTVKAGHKVTIDCPHDLVVVTYPGAIAQIITNLVLNAVNHAFDDGRKGEVRIEAQAVGDGAEISVLDNGKGVPPEVLKRLFEPFFTTKRGEGGSGLGMSIVHNLVRGQLGGEIVAENRPEGGLAIHFSLADQAKKPAADPQAAE